jgi:hypothetical protein
LLLAVAQRLQTLLKGTLLFAEPDCLQLSLEALLTDLFLFFVEFIELRLGRGELTGPLVAIALLATLVDGR